MKAKKYTHISGTDKLELSVLRFEPDNVEDIKGIVQLVHGMNEYKERYIPFMEFLTDNGFITGVFAPTTAEVGDYVLQTQKGEQKFFQVKTDDITVPAYRAFITGLKGSTAKSIGFNFDEATGIQALDALNAGTAVIYNASGVRQNSLQRGLNIVKMQDGSVRKVMVK